MNILQRLRASERLNVFLLFTITTLLSVLLVGLRIYFTSKVTFLFLVWNVFLALIPYAISTLVILYEEKFNHRWSLSIPVFVWLVFFPNAPYILTDLFHLHPRAGVPFWYDLALVLFFAWNGLMLGYASVMDIQYIITKHFNKWIGWGAVIGSFVLGSYGIYLGRYLRWNSWDIISSPGDLLTDMLSHFANPTAHPRTFGVTLIFSIFLVLGYLLLMQLGRSFRTSRQ